MTRAKSRTIRDVLNEYLLEASWWGFDKYAGTLNAHTKLDNKQIFNQALKEIQTLIKASKPEKDRIVKSSGDSRLDQMVQRKIDGYNNGIDDYEANLLKILGGESE